ncbi:MAG: Hpt domain-containing protein [bacterium]|nr:MAG: Hpt domain-containing protein [bacterium]
MDSFETGTLEMYQKEFRGYLSDFTESLLELFQEDETLFNAFCEGKTPEISEITAAENIEDETEDLIQSIESVEDQRKQEEEITDEDRNLRWLLRDYIQHEIEELSREINENLENTLSGESQTIILDNLKVLKDLGQIHKYPVIERVSSEIGTALKQLFKDKPELPMAASSSIQNILKSFPEYIDAVLEGTEKEIVDTIIQLKDNFSESLAAKATLESEVKFKESNQIKEVFSNVHGRFIERIKVNFKQLTEDPDNKELKDYLLSQIGHLKYWFVLFKLFGGESVLEVLQNWLRNPQQQEKLLKKRQLILETLQSFSDKLFEITPDEWTRYMENLTRIGKEPVEVGVDKSQRAFTDVTGRAISKLLQNLEQKDLNLYDFFENSLYPQLQQILTNSTLVGNKELAEFTQYLIENLPRLQNQEKSKSDKIQGNLRDIFTKLSKSVKESSFSQSVDGLRADFEKLVAGLQESQQPTVVPTSDEQEDETDTIPEQDFTIPEENLDDTFKDEVLGYLNELDTQIKRLADDLENMEAINNIGQILHTLGGSAKMLNRYGVAEIAGPLENLTELIQANQVRLMKQFISLCQKFSKNVKRYLDDKKVDPDKFIDSITKYISRYSVEADSSESAKKKPRKSKSVKSDKKSSHRKEIPPPEKSPTSEIEKEEDETPDGPLLKLKEKDPELLEIFKNEAKDKLDLIEEQLNLIDKFRYDKQTLQSLDHAVHEIRSAAKMLGFYEIGSLVDHLEELIEIIGKTQPENWREIIPSFRKCILVIRELTDKQQISQQSYDEVSETISGFVTQFNQKDSDRSEIAESLVREPETPEEIKPQDAMIQSFLQEGKEILEDMNFLLMKMEKEPKNHELLEQLLRSAHTLKGSSSMVYEHNLESLMHATEEFIETLQQNQKIPGTEHIDLLFGVVDEGEFILGAIANNATNKKKNFEKLIQDLDKSIASIGAEPIKDESKKKSAVEKKKISEFVPVPEQVKPEKPREGHLRMDLKQVDGLLNEAAELVINNNQFRMQIERFKNYLPKLDVEGKNLDNVLWQLEKVVKEQERLMSVLKPGLENIQEIADSQKSHYEEIKDIIDHLHKFQDNFTDTMHGIKESGKVYEAQLQKITKLSTQIHDEIMRARLIPIGMLFQRFHRPLRDIAKNYGKKVNVQMNGESTEIDRILADKLYEPMLHLLRNALDHGIETSTERKKRKKSEEGLIQISAQRERNNVVIVVEDDGKGIDLEKIRSRIAELKILGKEEIDKLSDHELYEFLMYPGFSTAAEVGTLSGRGIGLDIVRSQIHKLKGDLRIYSESAKYTRFSIRVPISITVTQAMLVNITQHTYALPLLQVEETTNISQENLILRDDGYFVNLRGMEIPVIHMSNLLKIQDEKPTVMSGSSIYPVIIVQDEGKKAGLLVDRIVQREEILIKNIGETLQRVKFIMGGTILADGRVVLVLDVPQIVFTSLRMKEKSAALMPDDFKGFRDRVPSSLKSTDKRTVKKKTIKGRKPSILIVDDSLSVRKFLSSMLTKNNYEVQAAKNGQTAIEMLGQNDYDAVITDLEMPQLSGYELIEQIRSDLRREELPIIVLTGRASKQIEQQSRKLGANEFIVKPFKDKDLLEKLGRYIDQQE